MVEKYNFSDFSDSEDDVSDFRSTIEAIRKLDNHKRVLPAERSEPSLKVDEYHLTREGNYSAVKLSELTRTLSKQPKHSKIAHDLKFAQKRTKTLPKPLEKPEAERISRSAGFEKVTRQLSYWDPVVRENRVAEHQVFPLPDPDRGVVTAQEFAASIVPETDLEQRMAEIMKKNNPNLEKEEDECSIFQRSLEEMIKRRNEAAQLRAKQSYMVAKARQQNKIKSKTYHRIARRERLRQQMKEFETLQKTNPEEALKRIEDIEKERALERVTLRHRNTGKWAKNQAVRAKYNKQCREVLSEQLKISRDLTRKVAVESDSGEDDNNAISVNVESDNPWGTGGTKSEAEIAEFVSGYRKFWDAKHNAIEPDKENIKEEEKRKVEQEVADEQAKRLLNSAVVAASASVLNEGLTATNQNSVAEEARNVSSAKKAELGMSKKPKESFRNEQTVIKEGKSKNTSPKKTSAGKLEEIKMKSMEVSVRNSGEATGEGAQKLPKEVKRVNKRKADGAEALSKKKRISEAERSNLKSETATSEPVPKNMSEAMECVISRSGKWTMTPKQEAVSVKKKRDRRLRSKGINAIFNKMNRNIQEKIDEKLKKLKKALGEADSEKKKKRKTKSGKSAAKADTPVGSSLRGNRNQRPDEDEGLDEQSGGRSLNTDAVTENGDVALEVNGRSDALPEIIPDNFVKATPTVLDFGVPDLLANGDALDDDEAEGTNQLTITEAFADDEVVALFEQEKAEEIEGSKPKDADISLPGWGSWGGHEIKPNERKRKHFIIKAPEPAKRRDENKKNVYINEKVENKLKPQQVSELPFPFKSVKDFEISVGAPISNTFIPESAYRKLTLPKVITRSGAIIEPLSKDVLAERRKAKAKLKTPEGKKAVKS